MVNIWYETKQKMEIFHMKSVKYMRTCKQWSAYFMCGFIIYVRSFHSNVPKQERTKRNKKENEKKYICMIFIGEFDEVTLSLLPSAHALVENLMEPRSNENKIKMKTKVKLVFC